MIQRARKIAGKVKRKITGATVQPAAKPDPSDYSTMDEPMEVPVQKEAYFFTVNNYISEGDSVLDVGCGIGYGLNLLSIKAGSVSGVDIDEKAIAYCKETLVGKNPKLKELTVFDGYNLPYKDNSFDVITTIDVLEHVEEYDRFVAELLRVAKKAVIIDTPNRRPEYTNPDGTPRNYWHLREWSQPELDKILAAHAKIDWRVIDGSWEGPFTVRKNAGPDTLALMPVLLKKSAKK